MSNKEESQVVDHWMNTMNKPRWAAWTEHDKGEMLAVAYDFSQEEIYQASGKTNFEAVDAWYTLYGEKLGVRMLEVT